MPFPTYVSDMDGVDNDFPIITHFEILVRKLLNIFAEDPLTFTLRHSKLAMEVCVLHSLYIPNK